MTAPRLADILYLADLAGESLAQRSVIRKLVLVFDQPVSLDVTGVGVAGSGGPVGSLSLVAYDGAAFTFAFGADPQVEYGSLKDGNYTLAVAAGAAVNALAESNAVWGVSFFRYFGDADGDRVVGNADAVTFSGAFGGSFGAPGYRSFFDFDGNGLVNAADNFQFKRRYGTALAP